VPFAARFGYTEQDLADRSLEARLVDEYARTYGYDPHGHWVLIVHADDSTEFFRFDQPEQMWCCELQSVIGVMIAEEVRQLPHDPPRPLAQHRPFRAYLRERLAGVAAARRR
jgi:hypothetical protein